MGFPMTTCACGAPARFVVQLFDGGHVAQCADCRSNSRLTFNVHELDGRPVTWCDEHDDCTEPCQVWPAEEAYTPC
jgi:hypothetical protein